MKARSLLVVAGLSLAGALAVSSPAAAAPLEKGHFDDLSTDTFNCESVSPAIPTRQDNVVHINFVLNQRGGPNVFPYDRESVSGKTVFTNLENGGTYTDVFATNSRDHKIVDLGEGIIRIFVQGSGADRWFDSHGRLVLVDSGNFRFSIDVDYNGTPGDPATTRTSPTPSGSSATPPGATSSTATSARTCSTSRPSLGFACDICRHGL